MRDKIIEVLQNNSADGWSGDHTCVGETDFGKVADELVGIVCPERAVAVSALRRIANPIKYLSDEAEREGAKLDGRMAVQMTKDASFYQEIANRALGEISKMGNSGDVSCR